MRVQCAVGNFELEKGLAKAKALVVATEDTNAVGTGLVDLRGERLDLTFHVAPKDISVLAARAPLRVRGSFKHPQVMPDAGVLASKGLASLLLGLINPVLAVVPLIETGPGKDSSCSDLIAQAQGWKPAEDAAARATKSEGARPTGKKANRAAGL